MKIVFFLAMILLFIVLFAISFALFRYSRRAWLIWGGILFMGFILLWRPISDFMDPWFLGSVGEVSASEVISAREFTVQGWVHMERHIVLAGTRLPATKSEQGVAKAEFLKLLGEKKRVTISFPQTVRRVTEPWPAIVFSGGVLVNERMLASGFLLPDGATLTPKVTTTGSDAEKPRQPREKVSSWELVLPTWGRYVLWVLTGFFGATSLGMVMNKRPMGLTFFLLIAGLAIRSIVLLTQSGATVWPPIICLIIVFLFAGGGRMAGKEFLEKHPNFRK